MHTFLSPTHCRIQKQAQLAFPQLPADCGADPKLFPPRATARYWRVHALPQVPVDTRAGPECFPPRTGGFTSEPKELSTKCCITCIGMFKGGKNLRRRVQREGFCVQRQGFKFGKHDHLVCCSFQRVAPTPRIPDCTSDRRLPNSRRGAPSVSELTRDSDLKNLILPWRFCSFWTRLSLCLPPLSRPGLLVQWVPER